MQRWTSKLEKNGQICVYLALFISDNIFTYIIKLAYIYISYKYITNNTHSGNSIFAILKYFTKPTRIP